jgi:glutathione S-transferase
MTLEYVDLETAKAAKGTRVVVNAIVPSPWSESLKGLLAIAGLQALAVRRAMDNTAIDAWTGIDNAPAVFHDREPVRANWAAIVGLVDRLAPTRGILPSAIAERADVIGTLDTIAGEGGIGWNARLAMIEAGLAGTGAGFPPQIAKYLGKRYGYSPEALAAGKTRMEAQLGFVAGKLRGDYFGGATPNALDVYSATFLTPVAAPITEAECASIVPPLRAAFASAHAAFGSMIPPALLAHRERMFTSHLPRPIVL